MPLEWFETWFDSPYYHTLYKNHDDLEASIAVDNLMGAIGLPPDRRVLDLACGKGRHSIHLAERGWDVTGLDISATSISYARQFEHDRLAFYQHDMRKLFRANYFHVILNMFTSFGYFEQERDHQETIRHIARGLVPGGYFLLDFFNAHWVVDHIVEQEEKLINGIVFHLHKTVSDGHIYKTVSFEADGKQRVFRERVRLFELADFIRLFAAAGLTLKTHYGDYNLSPFDPEISKRLILIAQKS